MLGKTCRLSQVTVVCSLIFLGSLNAKDFEIGGHRKVRATVTVEASRVVCRVGFIPVSCFDAAINRKVNQQKAQTYALLAMTIASGLQQGTVSAPNLHPVTPPSMEDGRLSVTYQADAIKTSEVAQIKMAHSHPNPPVSKTAATDGADSGRSLVSCLDDMRETLQAINHAFDEQTSELKAGDALEDNIADLEAAGIVAFDKLAMEAKDEKMLLQIEREDLLSGLRLSREVFLKNLETAYASLRTRDTPKP